MINGLLCIIGQTIGSRRAPDASENTSVQSGEVIGGIGDMGTD
jgi:hypothetical protein